jgi:uncharacterized lipoprotein YehR (DUF1307 family)
MEKGQRLVKKLNETTVAWETCNFNDLKKKDIFKMFEPNGKIVKDTKGLKVFMASTDAFINENGIWTINIY